MSLRRLAAGLTVAAATLVAPATMRAQGATCTITGAALAQGFARDACAKASDLFSFMAPQLGQAFAGGGAIIGTANTLGGFGKLSLNLRVNAVQGTVPRLSQVTLSGAPTASTLPTQDAYVPAPVVDAGIGIFPGIPLGLTRVLSLDGVVNVAYIPETDLEDLRVTTPSGRLALGFGGRLGILRDGLMFPAVSLSFVRRELPTMDINGAFAGGVAPGTFALTDFKLRTDAVRLSVSKKLGFFEIGGGAGRDTYDSRLAIGATVTPAAGGTASASGRFSSQVERDVYYGSLAFNLPIFKLAAEIGRTSGGTSVVTANGFQDGNVNDGRLFGSAGIRVSF